MARAKRRRNATAMALSIVVHAVVLTALALHAPRLTQPYEQAGPPEPVIPILIVPRTPPAPPGATEKPQPIRLHRRQLRRDVAAPEIPPLIVPPKLPTPAPAAPRGGAPPRISVQPSPAQRVATALRNSAVGCANPGLLSPAERERCNERLGRGAAEAPHIGPLAASPDKQDALDAAADKTTACRRYRESGSLSDFPGLGKGGC